GQVAEGGRRHGVVAGGDARGEGAVGVRADGAVPVAVDGDVGVGDRVAVGVRHGAGDVAGGADRGGVDERGEVELALAPDVVVLGGTTAGGVVGVHGGLVEQRLRALDVADERGSGAPQDGHGAREVRGRHRRAVEGG